jgi:hypothetical protein
MLFNRRKPLDIALDNVLHSAHNTITGIEALRVFLGAGSRTRDTPTALTDFVPSADDRGSPFESHWRSQPALSLHK